MPELPEVETIKISLQKKIVGKTIGVIQVLNPKVFQEDGKKLSGKKVLNIWRRAKILGVDLDGNITLLFHLKMTGQLIWVGEGERVIGGHPTSDMVGQMPTSYTRVVFSFTDGSHLYFNDQRNFGWVKIISRKSLIINHLLEKLGPEPLEQSFTWQVLKLNLLKRKSQPIKVALMDQSVVAGIGNIYANEALFNAKIDPRDKAADLTDKEFMALHKGIIGALKVSLEHGGSTIAHFVDAQGHKGYFLDYAYVYGRDGQKCKACGTLIKKIQQAGRGTYFCGHCQK